MRLSVVLIVLATINCVLSKNNVKSLTESLGQEVIEIGVPAKGLPADLEEEPSAEIEDAEKVVTSTTLTAGTKKDTKKSTTVSESFRRKSKDLNKIDETKDDEEAKIEKELAEIYKDNIDYKADSSEVPVAKEVTTKTKVNEEKKSGLRSKYNFKFQPDLNNKAEVERFRTSVDEISCDRRVTKLIATETPKPNSAVTAITNVIFVAILPSTILYL